jgi:hypothetical protein
MGKSNYYHYFVEGSTEEKIINLLKTDMQLIRPGKVQVFNVVEQKFTKPRFMSIKNGTTVVLVFDTDTGKISTLLDNIKFLGKIGAIVEVLCITQVRNLEDELMRSCSINQIKELTGSKTNADFKRDLLKSSNLSRILLKFGFDFEKFWTQNDTNEYKEIENKSYKIKLKYHKK